MKTKTATDRKIEPFRKPDILLFAALLLLTLLGTLLFFRGGGNPSEYAAIYVDGEKIASLPLSADTEYPVETEWGSNLVCVRDRKVFVEQADCPDLVCVHTPALSEGTSSVIACLPHRLIIRLEEGAS